MITVLSIPVLTAAKDHSIALKDVLMQAVWTAVLHPLQSFITLLLTILPLILIYLDEANRPTYGFIGTFFRICSAHLYHCENSFSGDFDLFGRQRPERRKEISQAESTCQDVFRKKIEEVSAVNSVRRRQGVGLGYPEHDAILR